MDPMANRSTNGRTSRGLPLLGALGVAILSVLGVAGVSAASLGTTTPAGTGADAGPATSCDVDAVSVGSATAYDAATGRVRVNGVIVRDLAVGCAGQTLHVTLTDRDDAVLATGTVTVTGTSQAVTMSPTADTALVVGAEVIVTG